MAVTGNTRVRCYKCSNIEVAKKLPRETKLIAPHAHCPECAEYIAVKVDEDHYHLLPRKAEAVRSH